MTNDKPFTKAGDFPPEILKLFDQYVHNVIDRRGFLDGAARFAVGGLTAAGFLEALAPRFAEAQQVAPNDPRLKAEKIEFPSPHGYGRASGYLASGARRKERRRATDSWWSTRTGASTRTSRTSRAGWPSRDSSPSRRTASSRSADTRATRTRRGRSSPGWTKRRPAKTSWPRRLRPHPPRR